MSNNYLSVNINSKTIIVPHNLKKVVDEIYKNFSDKDFRFDSLYSQIGKCRSHIYEMFVQHFNICPTKFLENVRLEFVLKDLVDGKSNIGILSSQSGFGSSRNLRYTFKKRFNISPSRCREYILYDRNKNFSLENFINKIWE